MEDKVDNNEGNEDSGSSAPKEMKHLDFITSLVLMGVSIYTAVEAHGFYIKSKKSFYASPGFMPAIIAGALFLLALYLMAQSLSKSSIKEIFRNIREAVPVTIKSLRFRNTIIGLVIFAFYIYVLLYLLLQKIILF